MSCSHVEEDGDPRQKQCELPLDCGVQGRKLCTASVSTFTLMMTEKKKTADKQKPNALATASSKSLRKGEATAVSSMHMREKTKAISS